LLELVDVVLCVIVPSNANREGQCHRWNRVRQSLVQLAIGD